MVPERCALAFALSTVRCSRRRPHPPTLHSAAVPLCDVNKARMTWEPTEWALRPGAAPERVYRTSLTDACMDTGSPQGPLMLGCTMSERACCV